MLCCAPRADTNTNNIFITQAQDYIISYCRPKGSTDFGSSANATPGCGTINVSSITTGKCVAKIPCSGEAALPEVTALYFSEERNELYVGDRQGLLHVYVQ